MLHKILHIETWQRTTLFSEVFVVVSGGHVVHKKKWKVVLEVCFYNWVWETVIFLWNSDSLVFVSDVL